MIIPPKERVYASMRAEKFVLSNGLEVVYLQMPKSRSFRLLLDVPVGASHDPIEKEGLSHILEHTVFCGSESMREEDLINSVRKVGGSCGASTSAGNTIYDIHASAHSTENLCVIADVLRQIITEPAFETERVEWEKKVIVNELYDEMDDPGRRALVEAARAIYPVYTDIIGTKSSILSVTTGELKNFMRANYDAGHMTLYAAGPLDKDVTAGIFEATLSAIPNLNMPPKPPYEIGCVQADRRSIRADFKQNHSGFMFVFPNAENLREKNIQFEAISHISERLAETVRRKYGCFYSPSFGIWDEDESVCTAFFRMSTTPEDSFFACQGILEFYKDLDNILSDDLIDASLASWKFDLSEPDSIDTSVLGRVKIQYKEFGSLFDLNEAATVTDTITPDEVREKARQILSGLTGMYVHGPQPEKLLSLEKMLQAMPARKALSLNFQTSHPVLEI